MFQKKWSRQVLFILALTFCLGTALLLTSPQLGEFYLSSRLREGMNSKLIHPYFEAAASGIRIFGAILCCGSALFAYGQHHVQQRLARGALDGFHVHAAPPPCGKK